MWDESVYKTFLVIFLYHMAHLSADSSWLNVPVDSNLTNPSNWSAGVPGSGATGFFYTSTITNLQLNTPLVVGGLFFNGVSGFTFNIHDTLTFDTSGVGLSFAMPQFFVLDSPSSVITFSNSSAGGGLKDITHYTLTNGAQLNFNNNSSTNGLVNIDVNGSTVNFNDTSAGSTQTNITTTGNAIVNLNSNILVNTFLSTATTDVVHNNGALGINQTFNLSGSMDGVGQLILFDNAQGMFQDSAHVTYSGGTGLNTGSMLTGNTNTIQGDVLIQTDATLKFNQSIDGVYSGTLSGAGIVIKDGTGSATFSADNTGFTGTTNVLDGNLILNNILGGDVSVTNSGILRGNGSLLGNLGISSGGTLFLNDATSTFHVGGNTTIGNGGTYETTINGLGQSSLLNVDGTLSLGNGTTLLVDSSDGQYSTLFTYHVAHANLVDGTFSQVLAVNPMFIPIASYTLEDVFITFAHSISSIAQTFNELQVAGQLDHLTNPTPEQQAILSALTALPTAEAVLALDQMTGVQYATALLTAEVENEQFLRELYNPMRSLLADPCFRNCCGCGREYWMQASAGHGCYDGNHDASSLELNNYSITVGLQQQVNRAWIFGGALSYAREDISYQMIGGQGISNSGIGGLYGLYRPSCYYVLGDIALGYNHEQIRRNIDLGALTYHPGGSADIFQGSAYIEGGVDLFLGYLLTQPFLGFEGGYYSHGRITEKTGTPLDLSVSGRDYGSAYSRLGAHFTAPITAPGSKWAVRLMLDLAWQYRLSSVTNHIRENFNGFGTEFPIHGFNLTRNIFDGELYLSKPFRKGDIFVQGGVQAANNATFCQVTVGLNQSW